MPYFSSIKMNMSSLKYNNDLVFCLTIIVLLLTQISLKVYIKTHTRTNDLISTAEAATGTRKFNPSLGNICKIK
jgi:hypothetical protein